MKKVTKVTLLLVAALALILVLVACSTSPFAGIFREYNGEDMLVKTATTLTLGENVAGIDGFNVTDDLVQFRQGTNENRELVIFNLRTNAAVLRISAPLSPQEGENADVAAHIYGFGANLIRVNRTVDGVVETAFFSKQGVQYLGFDLRLNALSVLPIDGSVFVLGGTRVYNGGNLIINSDIAFNASNFEAFGDLLMFQNEGTPATNTAVVLYNRQGGIVYTTHTPSGSNVRFFPLSADRGLYVRSYSLPHDAQRYTFSTGGTNKTELVYEIVEFRTGKRTVVKNFNFSITGDVTPLTVAFDFPVSIDGATAADRILTDKAKNFIIIRVREINDSKVLSHFTSAIIVDDRLRVQAQFDDMELFQYVCSDRALLYHISSGQTTLVDFSGNVLARFADAFYNPNTGLIEAGDNFYNKNGAIVIDSFNFLYISDFEGMYAYAERLNADGEVEIGFLDASGNFRQIVEFDAEGDQTHDFDFFSMGLYTYQAVDAETVSFFNFRGDLVLANFDKSDINVLSTRESNLSTYVFFVDDGVTKVLAFRI
jgi:hypothetical protein